MTDDLPEFITLTVRCGTDGCPENGALIEVRTFAEALILCGTCGQPITPEGT